MTSSRTRGCLVSLTLFVLLLAAGSSLAAPSYTGHISVYFSPSGGWTEAVVQALATAQKQVFMQAYSFTSAPIAKALLDAYKRGVKVLAVLDKSNQTGKYSAATFLLNAGIPTLIDGQHAIAHNKVMVIDTTTILTGSFNFTTVAEEKNAENLLVITDAPELAATA
jgi:phosphatidylserine/phosphatidylglycerophosphate/cardiolipin synthase-like enzyme